MRKVLQRFFAWFVQRSGLWRLNSLNPLAYTTCRLGLHCRRKNRIRKYDNGLRPALCRHCYRIVGRWT